METGLFLYVMWFVLFYNKRIVIRCWYESMWSCIILVTPPESGFEHSDLWSSLVFAYNDSSGCVYILTCDWLSGV